jgi:hypothetical protein
LRKVDSKIFLDVEVPITQSDSPPNKEERQAQTSFKALESSLDLHSSNQVIGEAYPPREMDMQAYMRRKKK